MLKISFNFFDVSITGFDTKGQTVWIKSVLKNYDIKRATLAYVFVSDDYLLEMNRDFLKHDYLTDIITFNNNEKDSLSGEMYISVDRVRDNADKFSSSDFMLELDRVMCHGVLHLLGYDDKTPGEKKVMRKEEEKCILLKNVSRETK